MMSTGLKVLQTGTRPPPRRRTSRRRSRGAHSYEALMELADELKIRMEKAALASTLPLDVDREFVDALAFEAIRAAG
jgi:hypothetical protein